MDTRTVYIIEDRATGDTYSYDPALDDFQEVIAARYEGMSDHLNAEESQILEDALANLETALTSSGIVNPLHGADDYLALTITADWL